MASVLLPSGIAKLRPGGTDAGARFLYTLGIPVRLARVLVTGAAGIEVVLSIGLLAATGPTAVVVAAATVVVMALYTGLILAASSSRLQVACGCHGKVGSTSSWRLLVRNGLLLLGGGVALQGSLKGLSPAVMMRGEVGWWLLGLALCVLLVGVLALEVVSTKAPKASAPVLVPWIAPTDPGDYVRIPIPDVAVESDPLGRVSLRQLISVGPSLLLVAPPGQESSASGWAERFAARLPMVDIGVLVRAVRSPDGTAHWLLDPTGVAAVMLGVLEPGPAAVLLGSDGWLAGGPVGGSWDAVEGFVEEIAYALAAQAPAPSAGDDSKAVGPDP